MSTTLYLVRHGEVHNPDRIYYGRLPGYRLSENGRAEAACAGRALAPHRPVAVYHSPLLRTRQTGRIIADLIGAPLHRSQLLLEIHSPHDGITFAALAARNFDLYTGAPPEFEQPPDVLRRLQRFAAGIIRRHPDQPVVAVSHGDVLCTAFLWAAGIPPTPNALRQLEELGLPGGYPAHGSILAFRLANPPGPPRWLGYEAPPDG